MQYEPLSQEEKTKWQPVADSLKTQLEALDSNPLTTRNTQWLDSIVAIQKKALEAVGEEKEQQQIAGDDLALTWPTLFQTIETTAQSPIYYNIVQAFLFYHSDLDALGYQAIAMRDALQNHLDGKNLKNLNPPSVPKGLSFARTDLWGMLFFLNASVTIDSQGTITPAYPEIKVVTEFVKALPKKQIKLLKNALQSKKPSKRIIFAQLIVRNQADFLQKATQYQNKSVFFSCLFFNSILLTQQGFEQKKAEQPTLQWPNEQILGTIDQLDKRLTQREKRKLVDKIKKTPEKNNLLTDALTWPKRNDALKKAYGVGAIITCLLGAATLTLDSNPEIFFPNKIIVDSITQHISTLSPITTACLGLSGFLLGVYLGYRHGKKAGAVACVGAIGLTAIPLLNEIGFANFLPTTTALAITQISLIAVASLALWAEQRGTAQTGDFC